MGFFSQLFRGRDAPTDRTAGSSYSQIIQNGKGEIIVRYPLLSDHMKVDRDGQGRLYYEYQVNTDDAHTMKGSTVKLQPHDVLHIPGLGLINSYR